MERNCVIVTLYTDGVGEEGNASVVSVRASVCFYSIF